jgi:hypothetical protein
VTKTIQLNIKKNVLAAHYFYGSEEGILYLLNTSNELHVSSRHLILLGSLA